MGFRASDPNIGTPKGRTPPWDLPSSFEGCFAGDQASSVCASPLAPGSAGWFRKAFTLSEAYGCSLPSLPEVTNLWAYPPPPLNFVCSVFGTVGRVPRVFEWSAPARPPFSLSVALGDTSGKAPSLLLEGAS